MREIKFRAWLTSQKKWYDVDITDSSSVGVLNVNFDYILCQYTGLKDKNGKEIYEGDIVKESYESKKSDTASLNNEWILSENIYQITWGKYADHEYVYSVECWLFGNDSISELLARMEYREDYQKRNGSFPFSPYWNGKNYKLEVIGNIYENPELLK